MNLLKHLLSGFKLLFIKKYKVIIDNNSIDYFLDINYDKFKNNIIGFNWFESKQNDILIILIKFKLLIKFTNNKNYITKNGNCFTNFQLNNIYLSLNDGFCNLFFKVFKEHIFLRLLNGKMSPNDMDNINYNLNFHDRILYKMIIENDELLLKTFEESYQKKKNHKMVYDLIHGSRFVNPETLKSLIDESILNYKELVSLQFSSFSLLFDEINEFEPIHENEIFKIEHLINFLNYCKQSKIQSYLPTILWDVLFIQNDIFYPDNIYYSFYSTKIFRRHEIKSPFFSQIYKKSLNEQELLDIFHSKTHAAMSFLVGYDKTPWYMLINIEQYYYNNYEYLKLIKEHPNYNKSAKGILNRILNN